MSENPQRVRAELTNDDQANWLFEAKRQATGALLATACLALFTLFESGQIIGLLPGGVAAGAIVLMTVFGRRDSAIVVGGTAAAYVLLTRVADTAFSMQHLGLIAAVAAIVFSVVVTLLTHRVVLAAERAGFSWTDEDEDPADLVQPPT